MIDVRNLSKKELAKYIQFTIATPAVPEDIKLLFDTVNGNCKVKASGKVNSFEKMVSLFDAGAQLAGTSSGIDILNRTNCATDGY